MKRLASALLAVALYAGIVAGCSDPAAPATACKPGKTIYCRCINLSEEGEQTCRDDGSGYDACLPCYGDIVEDAGPLPDVIDPCGNGIPELGEACDDGNKVDTDFCTNLCFPNENPPGAGSCPSGTTKGLQIHLWTSDVTVNGDTTTYGNVAKAKATCGGATGSTSNDRVYVLVPHFSGPITVTLTQASFNAMLFARTSCGDLNSETSCANTSATATDRGDETLTLTGENEKPIYVFVDGGSSGSKGTYTLTFTP